MKKLFIFIVLLFPQITIIAQKPWIVDKKIKWEVYNNLWGKNQKKVIKMNGLSGQKGEKIFYSKRHDLIVMKKGKKTKFFIAKYKWNYAKDPEKIKIKYRSVGSIKNCSNYGLLFYNEQYNELIFKIYTRQRHLKSEYFYLVVDKTNKKGCKVKNPVWN